MAEQEKTGQNELDTLRRIRYYSLSEAARRFPSFRNGAPVHTATVTRWILTGVKDRDGNRIKLQAKRLPGHWIVTDDAIAEFIEALTNDRTGESGQAASQTPASRRKSAERASCELDRIGI